MQYINNAISKIIARSVLTLNRKAEGFMEPGLMVCILAVIGGLFMTLLYNLFNDTIMPTVTQVIKDIFAKVPTIQ